MWWESARGTQMLSDVRAISVRTTGYCTAHSVPQMQCAQFKAQQCVREVVGVLPADSPLACACPPPNCESAPNVTHAKGKEVSINQLGVLIISGWYLLGVVFLLQLLVGVHQPVWNGEHTTFSADTCAVALRLTALLGASQPPQLGRGHPTNEDV
jgi:hypothetical protein